MSCARVPFPCTYLLFALFSRLVCERSPVSFFFSFPGEVWLYQQEMQICFFFFFSCLTLCLPSFPVFFFFSSSVPRRFYLFVPVVRFLQPVSSVGELQKFLHVRHSQKNPSLPAQRRQLECRGARAGNALLHVLRRRCPCTCGAGGKVCESVHMRGRISSVGN